MLCQANQNLKSNLIIFYNYFLFTIDEKNLEIKEINE